MSEANPAPEQVVQEYADLWNTQNYDAIPDVIAESFTGIFPEADAPVRGRDEFEQLMREFTAAFPDFTVEPTDINRDGNIVFAEGTYTMTHRGEFAGIPPTDQHVRLPALAKFRVENGQIAEHREYHDRQAILHQLND